MALSSGKLVCILCLLTFFSAQIQARESQFFSKVTSSNGNNNVQKTVTVHSKEEQNLSKQQQEPTFVAETQNGYGLYGQQNTVKYEPYTTPITSTATGSFEPYTTPTASNDVKYEPYTTPITSTRLTSDPYTTPTASNDVKYEPSTTPITMTRLTSDPYNTPTRNTVNYEPYTTPTTSSTKTQTPANYYHYPNNYNNNKNNKYYYNKDAFETERENMGDSKFQQNNFYNRFNNVEKQGMSDTRFFENGKYYYDVQNEKHYYPNQYQQNSRAVVLGRSGYNGPNGNSYKYNNSMEP